MQRNIRQACLGVIMAGFVVLAFGVTQAHASLQVSVTYTADNVVSAFYRNGAAPVQIALGPNAGNWRIADTAVLQDLSWGHEYQVIFRVANYVSEGQNDGNPAGFLAQIAGTGVAGGPVLTSSSWQVAVDNPALDYEDQVLTWGPATVYGKNEGPNIWTQNGGPVAGIDLSAEWIWDNRNYSQLAHPYLWVRGTFTTAVPEPGSVLIWSLVIVGSVACARWRRKRRVA